MSINSYAQVEVGALEQQLAGAARRIAELESLVWTLRHRTTAASPLPPEPPPPVVIECTVELLTGPAPAPRVCLLCDLALPEGWKRLYCSDVCRVLLAKARHRVRQRRIREGVR